MLEALRLGALTHVLAVAIVAIVLRDRASKLTNTCIDIVDLDRRSCSLGFGSDMEDTPEHWTKF